MRLRYDDNGGAGSLLVFIHGWCCDRSFFAPQIEYFGSNHRVISLDLRGHGESPAADDGDYSINAFAADVAEVIDEPAVVIGHSLGGVIATALAASRPDLVRGAVLVDPAPLVMTTGFRTILEGLLGAINGPDGEAARANLVAGMFMATDRVRVEEIKSTMAARPHHIAAPSISGLLDFDGRAALGSVTCPIASIASDGPSNEASVLKDANPSLLHAQTLGAGHFNQLEVPDQVNAMIERFLLINDL